jgi:hypothetical protein
MLLQLHMMQSCLYSGVQSSADYTGEFPSNPGSSLQQAELRKFLAYPLWNYIHVMGKMQTQNKNKQKGIWES